MIAGGLKAATERTFPRSWKLIGIKDPDEQETLVTRPSRNVLDDSERVLGFYESYRRLLEDHLLLNYRRSNVQPKITIIGRLRIGDTLYPLVHPVVGEYQRDEDGAISFRIQETGALFTGRGSIAEAALNDWLEQVHRAFQIIYPKCPFERTDEQEIQWGALTRFIDVQEYASQSTVTVHDIGVVKAVRPLMIAWYDDREETIGLDKMPREAAALEVGQWFECDVVRTQRTWDLKRVLSVRPIDPIQNLTEEGVQDFWQSLAPLSPRTEQDQEIRD